LIDPYNLYAFEADASGTIAYVQAFRHFAHGFNLGSLPRLNAYPPYFDGQYEIYAIGSFITDLLVRLRLISSTSLPTEQSVIIYTIRHMNAFFEVGACGFIFLSTRLLKASLPVAILAGTLFALSPQLLHIDLLRIDHLIIMLLCIVIYCCLRICNGGTSRSNGMFLGVAFGSLICTKIVAVVFVVPVALTLARSLRQRHFSVCVAFLVSSLTVACLLSLRYLRHASEIIGNVVDKIQGVNEWSAVLSKRPYLYYNWDQFLPQGIWFIIATGIGFIIACRCYIQKPKAEVGLMIAGFAIYSLLGIPSLKYARGGYHLLPFLILIVVAASGCLRTSRESIKGFPTNAFFPSCFCFLCLLPATWNSFMEYRGIRLDTTRVAASIRLTRSAPRDWLIENVPQGSRVAVLINSEWANPPIQDLGYDFSPKYFNFPYLDREQSAIFLPPKFQQLEAGCDIIVINDFHRSIFDYYLRYKFQLPEVAAKWDSFYVGLEKRYTSIKFTAEYSNYGVRSVEIFIVNPAILKKNASSNR
jgi:hypothetical protein